MKVTARDQASFLARPRKDCAAILLFGPEPMRTALTRQDLLKTCLGANAAEDMRLTRMTGAQLRSEPAQLQDAIKAIGFFPGPRGVLITDVGDQATKVLKDALPVWEEGDAVVILEAGNLGKGSSLRKLVEAAPNAAAIGIYANPPSRRDIEDALKTAGVDADAEGQAALVALASALDPGDFRQVTNKLALYMMGLNRPANAADIEAVGPVTRDGAVDDLVHNAAEGAVERIGPELQRLAAQGIGPTTLVIAAMRHFRQLHAAACHPGGPDSGVARMRPAVFGPRRDRVLRQVRKWGNHRLERALEALIETDLALRSGATHPPMALTERAFIRIAMMIARQR